jgi:hypothetical protein
MKKYLGFLLALSMGVCASAQQFTAITGTVTDSDAQIWGNALWVASINVPGGGTPVYTCGSGGNVPRSYTGHLDATGTFASAQVGNNTCIVPSGTTWTFTVNSATSAAASIVGPRSITGSTFDAGGYLSPLITAPRIPSANLVYAYNDTEVVGPAQGDGYIATLTGSCYFWNGTWTNCGGGTGACGGGVTANVSFSGQVGAFTGGCLAAVGNPFGMSISCSAAGTFETGEASTNPNTCTMSYSNGTPASGTLGDGTNTVTLTTPFTSGVLPYVYTTNTTFTAHATATNSETASAATSRTFLNRTFGGVGDPGATSATASGTNAVLDSGLGTLVSAGLGTVNTYGPYTPANQYIYVITTGTSCTFSSGGFAFPMNAPIAFSFTNQYGAVITEQIYQSVNSLAATFTLLKAGC